jgi:NDP-sugar pyrophosphorylase family protein
MKVILLASGENNKLQPLSEVLPSPMVPVANQPVMLYAIDMIARQGYKHVLVSLHQQAGVIESQLGAGQRWGISIEYLLQRDARGSAGALRWAQRALTETFLVVPANILIDLDIAALLNQHRSQGNLATMVVHVPSTNCEQRVHIDENGTILDALSPAFGQYSWCPTGVYIFEPEVLSYIPPRETFDIEMDLIPLLLNKGLPVRAHKMHGYWNPLDTFENYQKAQSAFMNSVAGPNRSSKGWLQNLRLNSTPVTEGMWVGRNCTIAPSARLKPPIFIGENCRIGHGVELGPDVVVGNNVIIDDEATIRSSTILDYTYVGRLVKIEHRIVHQGLVIDIPTGGTIRIADQFLIGSTHRTVDDSLLRQVFDSVTAFLLVLLSLPILLLLALLVWLMSGKVFEPVARLRSTVYNASSTGSTEAVFQLLRFASGCRKGQENWLSGWLQRWDLIRLPELWNVVRGELRLVGVKPRLFHEEDVSQRPWSEQARAYHPGFTGYWFTHTEPGCTEEEEQLADAYYTATRSWLTDLKILRQTPSAWLRRQNTVNRLLNIDNMIDWRSGNEA